MIECKRNLPTLQGGGDNEAQVFGVIRLAPYFSEYVLWGVFVAILGGEAKEAFVIVRDVVGVLFLLTSRSVASFYLCITTYDFCNVARAFF